MGDILEEASSYVECRECPWYKACVSPMRFNMDDLKRELQQNFPADNPAGGKEQELYSMLLNTASMAQNVLLEGCPVFVKRLKSSPRLAERLKKLMQEWGSET